jgi:hypothetical protein
MLQSCVLVFKTIAGNSVNELGPSDNTHMYKLDDASVQCRMVYSPSRDVSDSRLIITVRYGERG